MYIICLCTFCEVGQRHEAEENADDSVTLLDNKDLLDNVELPTLAAADLSTIPSVGSLDVDTSQMLACMSRQQTVLFEHSDSLENFNSFKGKLDALKVKRRGSQRQNVAEDIQVIQTTLDEIKHEKILLHRISKLS